MPARRIATVPATLERLARAGERTSPGTGAVARVVRLCPGAGPDGRPGGRTLLAGAGRGDR